MARGVAKGFRCCVLVVVGRDCERGWAHKHTPYVVVWLTIYGLEYCFGEVDFLTLILTLL